MQINIYRLLVHVSKSWTKKYESIKTQTQPFFSNKINLPMELTN